MALVVLAASLRFVGLTTPPRLYFDEVYYANDARSMLETGVEVERPSHPPLGKWLIAVGIAVVGFEPVGWRVASAAAGTLTVLVTYLAASRLFRRWWPAALAALLVAVDGLAVTMSRIAMLDVFLGLFVITGFWLVLMAVDRRQGPDRRGSAPMLALAGVAFGLGLATKWPAALALLAALAVVLVSWFRQARRDRAGGWELARAGGLAAVCLLVVPAAVYVLSYIGWFTNYAASDAGRDRCPRGGCDVSMAERTRVWWDEQLELIDYHRRLPTSHPYRSSAATWPLMTRPVLYYFERCPTDDAAAGACAVDVGNRAKILGLGNPVLWWTALLAYPVLAWSAVVRRRRSAAVVLVFLLGQYLPWLLTGKDGYFFYATPLVPFVAMSVAYLVSRAVAFPRLRWVPAVIAVLALVAFVYFIPIWSGVELPKPVVDARLWLGSWR
ncbi:MAG TPA: phospholipid carrier-dependent glycosyltransferase [Acidimicrobiales bacterium]|nr:phospholipid carrier-dependent glycosyltransferase [Acidimicrobiales bacterium]